MPVVAAPLLGFALGVVFAWAATEELARTSGAEGSRSLTIVTLFGALVFAPAAAYFPACFPDWSYAYVLDAQRRPLALDMALVMVDAASAPLGLSLFARASASRRSVLARGAAIPAALAALLVLAFLPRLRVVATHAQFHGDFGTEPVTGSAVGWALLWMPAIVLGSAAWTIRVLRGLSEPSNAN